MTSNISTQSLCEKDQKTVLLLPKDKGLNVKTYAPFLPHGEFIKTKG